MSNWIEIIDQNFQIPLERFAEGVAALGHQQEYGNELPSALENLYWLDTDCAPNGAIEFIGYYGRSSDALDHALERLAPIMEDGSYVAFHGETTTDFWRIYYEGGKAYWQTGYLAWK